MDEDGRHLSLHKLLVNVQGLKTRYTKRRNRSGGSQSLSKVCIWARTEIGSTEREVSREEGRKACF